MYRVEFKAKNSDVWVLLIAAHQTINEALDFVTTFDRYADIYDFRVKDPE